MAQEDKPNELARNERSNITIDYVYKLPLGWEIKFMIDGITKLTMPLKALRLVVEEGDRKESERRVQAKADWLRQSINVLGKGQK